MEFPVFLVKLDNIRTIEEASQKIFENSNLDERPERVEWPQGDTLRKRWLPGNAGETIGVNEINYTEQESFKYIFLNAYVERARNIVKGPNGQWLDRIDRINKVESEVLFLEYENNVFMAVYMNLTKSQYKLNFILKDLLKEDIWGSTTLLPPEFHISDSTYYWILSKFLTGDKIISETPNMIIKSFTGYSGAAVDDAHLMTGEGERISALLGTLAFIFGDDTLKSLRLSINFNENENFLFELASQGNVRLIEYEGDIATDELHQEKILLTLMLYKLIIPGIIDSFVKAEGEQEWNAQKKLEFINFVGDQILTKVNEEMQETTRMLNEMAGANR
ncbi:hypothetical protein FZC84_16800 [Rossellomorea vietnamensis]|uniref:Uncharacterized protein n=1 Tax=Rossellomorea vietnamensis TaxID=218284 RepID=A0A5D4M928_9BACI|nr:hypothetical protein [Rossellomorea vietnamensis]TYR98041.1 hypothetical protein FZC84_16800 [Rossellomorea vietnamensis]